MQGKLLDARSGFLPAPKYDVEMLQETGICSGIENYSRHLSGSPPGTKPNTLVDYFPKDYLLIIDESHVTIPQINAMHAGDCHRRQCLSITASAFLLCSTTGRCGSKSSWRCGTRCSSSLRRRGNMNSP